MAQLRLNFACGPYDRTQALRDGTINPEGIELNYLTMQPAEIFWRMLQFKEFDASEMSLSNYITLVSEGNPPFIAVPAFPSRVFRHGYFFINTAKGITSGADLKGKRGGVPEYSMTAAVYMRGLLQHDYGVDLKSIEWLQGRTARLSHALPADVRLKQGDPTVELGDLLERGEIDFLMTANNPLAFWRGSPKVQRLFPNYREEEKDYYKRTKIFPIMHLLALRRDVYEAHPFIASSLFDAMCESKERARIRMRDLGTLNYMLPWMTADIDELDEVFGGDAWPYGIESNRPTLEALMMYLSDQAIIKAPIPIEDLFMPTHGRYDRKTGRKA